MDERGQAIGRAGGIGNDVVLRGIVFAFVYTDDDGDVVVLGGSGDNDFFGACNEVTFGLFAVGEQAGRFDDQFYA